MATPGASVGSGALITPGGAQGPQGATGATGGSGGTGPAGPTGSPAWTTNTAGFTIPAIGSTVVATVADTSWAVVGEFVWVATAGGDPNTPMALQVTAKTATTLTLLNSASAGAVGAPPALHAPTHITGGSDVIALAAGTSRGLLIPPSGNTTDVLIGTHAWTDLPTAIQPTIWSQTRRVFQAIGNPTFEVDQRNVFNGVTVAGGASYYNFILDRWLFNKTAASSGALGITVPLANTGIPGITNSLITTHNLRATVNTAQASMAAGDAFLFSTILEGPSWRELATDVHSISILCRSSVANLKFAVAIRDSPTTKSLVKLCSLGAANTYSLIQLPGIPVFPSGNFTYVPGNAAYELDITLASGTGFNAPALDTWQSGTFIAAPGQSNFLATAGATFDLAYVGHEPGAVCTTPIDCPFGTNLDGPFGCVRYFQKSYPYNQAIGGNVPGYAKFDSITAFTSTTFNLYGSVRFPKIMAKVPGFTAYHPNTGAANQCLLYYATSGTVPNASAAQSVSTISGSDSGISSLNCSSGTSTAPASGLAHWTADTNW